MLENIERRVSRVEPRRVLACVTKHVAHVNSAEIERRALARSTGFAVELQRAALLQVRAVMRLPVRLGALVANIDDERQDPGLRLGLRAILHGLERHVAPDATEVVDLVEIAFVLELLLARLHPWLPPSMSSRDSELELDALRLALAPEEQVWLQGRIAWIWRRFHRLRALGPDALRDHECPMQVSESRLLRLLADPRARVVPLPAPPELPRCDTDALEADAAIPRFMAGDTSSMEISLE